MPQPRTTLATLALGLAVLSAVAAAAGLLAIHAGLAAPFSGFRVFGLGLVGSLPAVVLALAACIATRGPDRAPGRRIALRALLLSGGMAAIGVLLAIPGLGVPAIHDITTDPDDPPDYVVAPGLAGDAESFAYPLENGPRQRTAYPDLAPIVVGAPPPDTHAAAVRAATALRWDVVHSDASAGALEATSTSRVFRFVDDVSIRVRGEGSGSRVDVRSRSRVGKSDLGANAARIRAFDAELRSQLR